jgi:predicted DNA-binding protein (MmcQ/YjbR family)
MNRSQLDKYITDYYGVRAERLFEKNPGFQVYRHNDTKKWFAMIMDLPESRLGLDGQKIIDVVNLKCDPILIGSLRLEQGFYPAYHMNKENWITAALDGSVSEENIKFFLDLSFELTAPKIKQYQKNCNP